MKFGFEAPQQNNEPLENNENTLPPMDSGEVETKSLTPLARFHKLREEQEDATTEEEKEKIEVKIQKVLEEMK